LLNYNADKRLHIFTDYIDKTFEGKSKEIDDLLVKVEIISLKILEFFTLIVVEFK